MRLIERHIKSIAALCRKYKVNRLFVFGSVLTDRFNDGSDIDMVVDFKKDEVEDYFDNYFDFKYSLQDLFGREVDLVEEQTIRNPYFRKSCMTFWMQSTKWNHSLETSPNTSGSSAMTSVLDVR